MTKSNLILLGGAAVLLAGILWMPRVPHSADEVSEVVSETAGDPVQRAIEKVNGSNPMEGIMELRELADGNPPNLDAVFMLGQFSIQSGQLDKARQRFTQVVDANPTRVDAHWELAMLDLEEGFLEEAVEGFDLCIAADEVYVNGRFFKARCLETMGRIDEALTEYKSYLPLAPDTVVAQSVEGIIERLESGSPASGS
ncbi:MAG: hypothetical protein O3B70_01340 [Bacteroidetes bacterium]|nr:hypothetical protein [Bacteroidota bacterium]MDA0902953.1 hypothetical protein [Bacteroidota bacterium]MDA1241631.1 hypothetical protein [Bacteroidota bacterium]